jgi:hypothetical protein
MIKVGADLNALTADETRVQLRQDSLQGAESGMRVILYAYNDFEVEAIVERVELEGGLVVWYGVVDWNTYRDLLDTKHEE